ncbi:uncharacterized protein LOC116177483 [Photinus pyralis]|uniref:uncharacterized protein LOC116177483 n=1 Tax=Photinus pyralis TaxID=7054 RepID=UPI0012675551|nr:uncharacterized protein LOC116177483 [Photinus pyralis]
MSCIVRNCKNKKRFRPEGISFHWLPQDGMLDVWLDALNVPRPFTWTRNKFVCSTHFKEGDKIKSGCKTILRRDAVPSLTEHVEQSVDDAPQLYTGHACSSAVHFAEVATTSNTPPRSDPSHPEVLKHPPFTPPLIPRTTLTLSISSPSSNKSSSLSEQSGHSPKRPVKMHYSSTTTKPRESSSSTDSSTRRKRICSMVKEFHSYSTSPRTVKVKLQRAQNKQVKTRRKLYQAKKTT